MAVLGEEIETVIVLGDGTGATLVLGEEMATVTVLGK
jgi:hypothetical protein